MDNVFLDQDTHNVFKWENLGDIKTGRGDLGEEMPVLVYRLMQYAMLDVLTKAYGSEVANDHFRGAGHLAGSAFAENVLDTSLGFDAFVAQLQEQLKTLKIGILRMEFFDPETGGMTLTVGEDLDCSGLPVTNEAVCTWDEGFIAGILEVYTGKEYQVKETDCWANGDRICRFKAAVIDADG